MSDSADSIFDAPDSDFDFIGEPSSTADESPVEQDTAAEDGATTTEVEAQPEEGAQEAAPEAVPAAVQAKKVTFRVGDSDVALDETASFEHRVDGKKVKLTLNDLITNYAGKIPIERRMQELAEARKVEAKRASETETKIQRHVGLINDMYERMQKGDVLGAVALQLEAAGRKEDPYEVVRTLRTQMIEQAKKLATMSEAEIAAFEQTEKHQYLQSKYDRLIQQRDHEKAQAQFQERVATAMGRANATMEEYVEQRGVLEDAYKQRGMDPSKITPEDVANHIQHVRNYTVARDAIKAVDPELIKNEQLWDHVVYLRQQNPSWTQEDLTEVVRNAQEFKRSKAVSAKVAKAPVATVAAAAAKAKTAPVPVSQQRRQALLKQAGPAAYGEFDEDDLHW